MNLGSDTSRITLRNLARDEDGCARFVSQLFSSVGATDEKKRQRPRGISSTSSCNIVGANYSDSNICRRDMNGIFGIYLYISNCCIIEKELRLTDVTRFQTLKESGAGSIVLIVFESIRNPFYSNRIIPQQVIQEALNTRSNCVILLPTDQSTPTRRGERESTVFS